MIEDIFKVLTSHPALISSDISQLSLIIISQEINSLAYNNVQIKNSGLFMFSYLNLLMKLKACKMSMLPPQTGPNLFLIIKRVYTIIIIKYNYIYIYIY